MPSAWYSLCVTGVSAMISALTSAISTARCGLVGQSLLFCASFSHFLMISVNHQPLHTPHLSFPAKCARENWARRSPGSACLRRLRNRISQSYYLSVTRIRDLLRVARITDVILLCPFIDVAVSGATCRFIVCPAAGVSGCLSIRFMNKG